LLSEYHFLYTVYKYSIINVDFNMAILRDAFVKPEPNIGEAFNQHSMNSAKTIEDTRRTRVDQLLHRNPNLWRGCDMAGQGFHGFSTGFPELDDILPGRGWPQSGLVEIISRHWGMGELRLLIPLMRSITEQEQWVLWITPPYVPYAPALAQAGIDIHQILVIKQDIFCKDALWSMEKALNTKNCGMVLAWQNWLPGKVLHRLQLAAVAGGTLGILFKHKDSKHSQLPLRLQIKDSCPKNRQLPATEVTVIKARGNFRPLTTQIDLYPHN